MSYNRNMSVEADFKKLLDIDEWVEHEGADAQRNLGDYFNKILNLNIDFKVDCYDNENNIVLEVNQISGSNWIDELDENSFIGYLKVNTGICFFWKVKQLKDFKKTDVYKNRKEIKAWSQTTFKNFRLKEMPEIAFIKKFDVKNLKSKYLQIDSIGDNKYVNLK